MFAILKWSSCILFYYNSETDKHCQVVGIAKGPSDLSSLTGFIVSNSKWA